MYAVILAGGGGTRLWPLSRPHRPKPFLRLVGERTLLRATFERILPSLDGPGDVAVVADRQHAALVSEELPELPPRNVLAEPRSRNTAAAVALAALALERDPDEVMAVLPADHLVVDEAAFRAVLRQAAEVAAAPDRPLVTLGIAPSGPETGYGYLVAGAPRGAASAPRTEPGSPRGAASAPRTEAGARAVAQFLEKPPAEVARALLAGDAPVAWNAGIFLWRRDVIREALATWAPDIAAAVATGVEGGPGALEAAYEGIRAISIDHAVLEPASLAGRVAMLRAEVGWSDVGSWAALRDALVSRAAAAGEPAGVVGTGRRYDVGSTGTLVVGGERLVVTVGLRDTIVVVTPDALLVCAADQSQAVRAIAEQFAQEDRVDA
jgi:mannose-1-phosphate guanylyltransferase/mannose-6-phosphate isomerase